LSSLAFSKPARAVCGKTDRYGRQVCQVFIQGRDVGLAQVAGGMAWHYRQYERDQAGEDRWRYAEAQDEARAARRGLWQDARPVPPWDFRRSSAPIAA
jgi:endonuclease YncB( thermonuclease family)